MQNLNPVSELEGFCFFQHSVSPHAPDAPNSYTATKFEIEVGFQVVSREEASLLKHHVIQQPLTSQQPIILLRCETFLDSHARELKSLTFPFFPDEAMDNNPLRVII